MHAGIILGNIDEERNRRLRREDGPISYEYAVEEEDS